MLSYRRLPVGVHFARLEEFGDVLSVSDLEELVTYDISSSRRYNAAQWRIKWRLDL
jgi:hypothetical protein